MKVPIYTQSLRQIIALQYVTATLTWLYLKVSRSQINHHGNWIAQPNTHYVLAANHTSWFDPFVITTALPKGNFKPLLPYRYIATPKFLSNKLLGSLMIAMGCYPSHEFKNYPYGLEASIKLLNDGNTIVIFPQGKRTGDRSAEVKRGVSELGKQASTLVIPIYLSRQNRIILPSYKVEVGEALDASNMEATEIMAKIYDLDTPQHVKL